LHPSNIIQLATQRLCQGAIGLEIMRDIAQSLMHRAFDLGAVVFQKGKILPAGKG
jgi:hypothetical protein